MLNHTMPRTRLFGWILALLIGALATATRSQSAVEVPIDVAVNRHPIDPRIYGVAFADASSLADLRIPLHRWGGNPTSTYNWQANASNRASDWYFESIADSSSAAGASADAFISLSKTAGVEPIITIPMIGWVAKIGPNRENRASFSIAKYGAQTGADTQWFPDAGNGVSAATGQNITGNDPTDASVASDGAFQRGWVQHLIGRWGASGNGGVRYYALDNEPSIWHSTHRDVHPTGASMDEVFNASVAYAAQIKAVDPGALVMGPEEWGWSGYLYSGRDLLWGQLFGWGNLPDRTSHGNADYVAWLLAQMRQRDVAAGQRLLDIFSLHYYPQGGEYGNDTSTAMQQRRNRSTRSLWDPNYVDETWIATQVRLIPRMRAWVTANYPGTQTAITEYNWGAEGHINGATTLADILGIFGRESLDLATLWTIPAASTPTYKAIKLYRNYDGQGSGFGGTSVSAVAPNPDSLSVFVAERASSGALTVMAVNKDLSTSPAVNFRLANFAAGGPVQVWRLTSSNAITRLADTSVTGATLAAVLPAQSITLFVVPVATGGGAVSITAAAGTPQSAIVNSSFGVALQATVRDAATSAPIGGVTVTFTAPASGPGATFNGALSATATTNTSGMATALTLTANGQIGSYSVTATTPGATAPVTFSLTNTLDPALVAPANLRILNVSPPPAGPSSVDASGGTPQSASVNTAFATAVRAIVRNASSNPVSGIAVTFTAPASGASARFSGSATATAVTDLSGVATAPTLTANGQAGSYIVAASVAGVSTPANFSLTNNGSAPPPGPGGTWTNVTPPGFNSSPNYPTSQSNFGFQQVLVDPVRPGDLYVFTNYQGVWKSTDYGVTWTMVSTGTNSDAILGGRNWAATIDPNRSRNPATPPTLYTQAGYSTVGKMGIWKSTDGGVNWTSAWTTVFDSNGVTNITSQVWTDMQGLSVDPNNSQHLLTVNHGNTVGGAYDHYIFETTNGGATWINRGSPAGHTHCAVTFITSTTWIATAEGWGPGSLGTFVTTNSGGSWTNVGQYGKAHGNVQINYLDPSGTLYLAAMDGIYKATSPYSSWTRVDGGPAQSVIGTTNYLYASYGWASLGTVPPGLRRAVASAGTTWDPNYTTTPSAMTNGAMGAAVTFDSATGKYIVVTGNWLGGLWRYVE